MCKQKQHKQSQQRSKNTKGQQKWVSFERWVERQEKISAPFSVRPKLRKTIQDRKPFLAPSRIHKEITDQ